jgi:hypothetical protein
MVCDTADFDIGLSRKLAILAFYGAVTLILYSLAA